MADFTPNIDIPHNTWTDITGPYAGLDIAVQNCSSSDMRIWFGPTPPADKMDGVVMPCLNWPPLFGTVTSAVWVYGVGDVHISEAD